MIVATSLMWFGLTLPLAPALARPVEAEPSRGALRREALIEQVLARNPDVETALHTWRAAFERGAQARALPDPSVGVEIAPLSAGGGIRFGQTLSLSQRFPFPGKLRLQEQVAGAEADAARSDLETVRLDLALLASTLYDEYYYVRRAVEINARHVELLEEFKLVATARYAAGTAAQQDPILAEVELAHVEHLGVVLESERQLLVAQINELLHQNPAEELPPPPTALPIPDLPAGGSEALQLLALEQRPELQAQESTIRARELDVALRRKELRPDFEAGTSWNTMWDEIEHRWMVGASINLPVRRGRIRAGIAESEANWQAARSVRTRMEDAARAEVHRAWTRARESHHVVDLYRSRLLPAAADHLRAALASFESGITSSLSVIEAEKTQRTTELGYERALTELHQRLAELDRALGHMPGAPIARTAVHHRSEP